MTFYRSHWPLLLIVALTSGLPPRRALAQVAPTGAHYAGRASDTGFDANGPTAAGAFPAAVPLDLPQPRGAIPLPLRVAYTGRGFGSAGLGWDVPLSYVRLDKSLAHRRPTTAGNTAPGVADRISMMLQGAVIDVARKADGSWVARQGATELLLKAGSSNDWLLYDGNGMTYHFTDWGGLSGHGVWLLTTITGRATSNVVTLTYSVPDVALPGGGTGKQIDLTSIRYDTAVGCTKHEIALAYDPESRGATVDVVARRSLRRAHARAPGRDREQRDDLRQQRRVASLPPDVSGGRRHGQPRLSSVAMFGRTDGPAAGTTSVPIANYQYGSATHGGQLAYELTQTIAMPTLADTSMIPSSVRDTTLPLPSGSLGYASATWQSLTDVTGDGRPDLVFKQGNQLVVAPNLAASGGVATFGSVVPLTNLSAGPFEKRASSLPRFGDAFSQIRCGVRPSTSTATAASTSSMRPKRPIAGWSTSILRAPARRRRCGSAERSTSAISTCTCTSAAFP